MTMDWTALISAGIPAAIGIIAVIVTRRLDKRVREATMTETIMQAAERLNQMHQQEIDRLTEKVVNLEERLNIQEDEMTRLRNYVRIFRAGVRKLIQQIEDEGLEPVWHPDKLPPVEDLHDGGD